MKPFHVTKLQTKITQIAKERGMRNNTKGAAQIKIIINLTLRMQAVQHHA
jgi:hypothetical protein